MTIPNRQSRGERASADAEWVQRYCAGDREAFARLYDRYAGLVRAIAYNTTGRLNDAQDLAQDVFLRAWRDRDRLQDPEKFSAWLIGISRHVCMEWRRKQDRDRHAFGDLDTHPVATTYTQDREDENKRLHHALQQLPETDRLAIHLFYLRDEPTDQARALLGLSRSGFYKRLDRARQKLHDLLGKHQESTP